jgi:signal peptidase II
MRLTLFLAAVLVLLLDQATKELLARRLPKGRALSLGRWIRIRHVARAHPGFLLHDPRARLLAWAMLLTSISLIIRQGYFFQSQGAQLGLGMGLGGACGNVCDQLRQGAVTDFVQVGCWPTFNLADLNITIGIFMALWFLH